MYRVVGHGRIIPGSANHYRAFLSGSISLDPPEPIGAGARVDQLLNLPVLEVKDLPSRCSCDGHHASPRQANSAPTALGNYKRLAFCPRQAYWTVPPAASRPNPKSKGRNPKEGRIPKAEATLGHFGFRVSAFLRPSDFGLRVWAFALTDWWYCLNTPAPSERPLLAWRVWGISRS